MFGICHGFNQILYIYIADADIGDNRDLLRYRQYQYGISSSIVFSDIGFPSYIMTSVIKVCCCC